jgi:hypothetical protein
MLFARGEGGEQSLVRGRQSLEIAKREAQKTLAPILDRMRRSKKVRSAEKVLRRLSTILEYPYRMQKALDREDYIEVINIYQRILLIPTSSSLRILQRVRESAENIIKTAKNRCLSVLLTPSPEVGILLRHAKISRDLEGDDAYRENLKLCFASQCHAATEALQAIHDTFLRQAAEEFTHGEEVIHQQKSQKTSSDGGGGGVKVSYETTAREVEREIAREMKRRVVALNQNAASNSNGGGNNQSSRMQRQRRYSKSYGYDEMEDPDLYGDDMNNQQDEFSVIFDRDLDAGHADQDALPDGNQEHLLLVAVRS